MRRCVVHKSQVPTPKVKVTIMSEVKLCLKLLLINYSSKFDETSQKDKA